MKKALGLLTVILCMLFFTACNMPKYPIDDPPVVKIDTRLLGKWKVKYQGQSSDVYTVTKQNDYEYSISANIWKRTKAEHYTAFLSYIDSSRFLNVYSKDDSEKSYLFIRLMEMNGAANKIKATCVNDTTMQYLKNSAQIRQLVTTNLNKPDFYGDSVWLYKVNAPKGH